jgi:ribosomal protein S18 acetylase RimI-like enzyme
MTDSRLDNPVWHALTGRHRQFAIGTERTLRYRPDIGPFAALADVDDPQAWSDLAALVPPGGRLALPQHGATTPPAGWVVLDRLEGSQMVAPRQTGAPDDEDLVELTAADADELMALTELTKPGPFGRGTVELGGFLGIRIDGRLAAMAGRRFSLTGWTEISAVCTHPDFRSRGLSRRLVGAVAAGVQRDGDDAFLHVVRSNVGAIRLYESMGFTHRADVVFTVVTPRDT